MQAFFSGSPGNRCTCWHTKHNSDWVYFEKIPRYNGVNLANGYGPIAIHTPEEVTQIETEDEDV